jgi:hypothetical protein
MFLWWFTIYWFLIFLTMCYHVCCDCLPCVCLMIVDHVVWSCLTMLVDDVWPCVSLIVQYTHIRILTMPMFPIKHMDFDMLNFGVFEWGFWHKISAWFNFQQHYTPKGRKAWQALQIKTLCKSDIQGDTAVQKPWFRERTNM